MPTPPVNPGPPTLPPQANKPTEQEKKDHPTRHLSKGKIMFGDREEEVDIDTETTPNATGGYDTVVRLPRIPISAVKN
jgi:hypothetical protein